MRRRPKAAASTLQHVSTFTLWPTSRNDYRNTYQYSAPPRSVPMHTLHNWTEAMLSIDASRITASYERQGPAEPPSCVLAEDFLSFIVLPLLRLISIAPAVWSGPRLRSDDGPRNEMWSQCLSINCIDSNMCISHSCLRICVLQSHFWVQLFTMPSAITSALEVTRSGSAERLRPQQHPTQLRMDAQHAPGTAKVTPRLHDTADCTMTCGERCAYSHEAAFRNWA